MWKVMNKNNLKPFSDATQIKKQCFDSYNRLSTSMDVRFNPMSKYAQNLNSSFGRSRGQKKKVTKE